MRFIVGGLFFLVFEMISDGEEGAELGGCLGGAMRAVLQMANNRNPRRVRGNPAEFHAGPVCVHQKTQPNLRRSGGHYLRFVEDLGD